MHPVKNEDRRLTEQSPEFHETCHSVTFIVLVNSHQRWKQTRNRVCFLLWCELTLALWCHSIAWSLFSWNKMITSMLLFPFLHCDFSHHDNQGLQVEGCSLKGTPYWSKDTIRPPTIKMTTKNTNFTKDTGYAWIILLCSFLTRTIDCILLVTFGIFILEFIEYFHMDQAFSATSLVSCYFITMALAGK